MLYVRVYCPYCGSTAQVKTTGKIELSKNGSRLTETLKCGCGCTFTHGYERNRDGYWQIDWTQIVSVEKK